MKDWREYATIVASVVAVVLIMDQTCNAVDPHSAKAAIKSIPMDYDGTGTVLSDNGLVLTNLHVVRPNGVFAKGAYVVLLNRQVYAAQVIYTDNKTDLAILKIVGSVDLSMKKPVLNKNLPVLPCLKTGVNISYTGESLSLVAFVPDAHKEIQFTSVAQTAVTLTSTGIKDNDKSIGWQDADLFVPIVYDGNSGSPIVDSQNHVVAVTWGSGSLEASAVDNSALLSFIKDSETAPVCTNEASNPINAVAEVEGTFDN